MANEQPDIPCPLKACETVIEGVRPQPEAEKGPRIAAVLGVHGSFFGDQWQFQEARRIEEELSKHLESHSVLDFVTYIVELKAELEETLRSLARCADSPCPRLCCSSRE